MKQIILTIAAATIALSASAIDIERFHKELLPQRLTPKTEFGVTNFNYAKAHEIPDEMKEMKLYSARKADGDTHSIEGEWIFQFGDYYLPGSSGFSINVIYQASISSGYLWFINPDETYMPFECPYEEGQTELVFSQMFTNAYQMPDGTRYFVYQEPFKYIWETGNIDRIDLVGTWNPEEGFLTFPPDSGMQWVAYYGAEPLPENIFAYVDVFDFEGAYLNFSDEAGWRDFGEALFTDGWILPGLGIDQMDPANQWYVPLQQHKVNKFLFRLVDPYHCGPFDPETGEIENTSPTKGYIQFNITDAKHVLFDKVDAGFEGGTGINAFNKFYCYNMLRWYMNIQNATFSEAVMAFSLVTNFFPSTTFEDNTVKLEHVVRSSGQLCYDANFGMANKYDAEPAKGGYVTLKPDGKLANMTSYIKFPDDYIYTGVESIETDIDENAPVEYFNLQGMRIIHPEAGQLLIKRQGTKSEKIIY